MKILAISGKAESGKDSTAIILKEMLENKGEKVAILHFADYIKYYAKTFKDWDGVKTDEWRTFLQRLGTETIKQELGMVNFHVNRIVEDIKILGKLGYTYFLIPDARFISEITYLTAYFPYDTKSIRVHRLGYENSLTDEQRQHSSECDLDYYKFDTEVYVQDGLEHLSDEISRIFSRLY